MKWSEYEFFSIAPSLNMDPELNERGLLGLRFVQIPRYHNHNGFGFTLRHFIVYPPDIYGNDGRVAESGRNGKGGDEGKRLGKVTEPVDTIFVKSVRENGPASRAGLCVGDRIVSVNGKRVFGKSYDQVVHFIQSSGNSLALEVSPKQYDTLQLFYEEKAYRPETNLPFNHNVVGPYRRTPYNSGDLISRESVESSYESVFYPSNLNEMSFPSSGPPGSSGGQILNHLPRPTPYKSPVTPTWSHLNNPSSLYKEPRLTQQSYYPFNHLTVRSTLDEKSAGAKSAESVLTVLSPPVIGNNNRYGSMECLSTAPPNSGNSWKTAGPGYRFSISTAGSGSNELMMMGNSTSSNLVSDLSSSAQPHRPVMLVTMTGSGSDQIASATDDGGEDKGKMLLMADKIRRSCEQKEEFLKRPNMPMLWAPTQNSTPGFPKEFYAQPQKFTKVPWPPDPPKIGVANATNEQNGSVDWRENKNESKVDGRTAAAVAAAAWAAEHGAPRNRITAVGSGKLHCDPPPDWKPTNLTIPNSSDEIEFLRLLGHNHKNDIGSGVDGYPPSVGNSKGKRDTFAKSKPQRPKDLPLLLTEERKRGPKPPVRKFSATTKNFSFDGDFTTRSVDFSKLKSHSHNGSLNNNGYLEKRRGNNDQNYNNSFKTQPSLGTDVILRKKEGDPDYDSERLVRRVSYLKATSSPIEMDRKSGSPTSPTKSPSEFRHFGSYRSDKIPDDSAVVKEGPVHFKIRVGDTKKGGYYRSWRQGWAQIRRSGILYLSKERVNKEVIANSEDSSIILTIGLKDKDGLLIEPADDYTKRKHVLRMKTTGENVPPVEALIQAEDSSDLSSWMKELTGQQGSSAENNNYFKSEKAEGSSPKASLLRSLLPYAPPGSSGNNGGLLLPTNPTALATSPKSKTWKGKVARQWKKMHSTSSNSTPPPFNPSSIPESGATFGVMLDECPMSESGLVPRVLEFCVETVETRGLNVVGIYRIPGNNAAVAALTDSLNKGNEPSPEQDPRWNDVHVISSLLKSFLRKLPDPLLTSERYPEFIKGAGEADAQKALERLSFLVNDLPDVNYETLRHLFLHLRKVAENSEKNRMEPKNLAIVFGPTIVRTAEENVASMVNDMKHQCKIVELLINHAPEMFKEKERDSPSPDEEKVNGSVQSPSQIQPPGTKIESDIRASLIQAAQRKVLKQHSQPGPPHNTYGLPKTPPQPQKSLETWDRERSTVDESGFIRSYAGLGAETEQRVRQFEMETRAMIYREPNVRSPNVNHVPIKKSEDADRLRMEKLRLEAEWRKAKDDMETEDFYDQLADNPSSIIHHRGHQQFPHSITHNVSSSSISSNNSSSVVSPPGYPAAATTWPIRLGPAPFKSPFIPLPSLPPKPPSTATTPTGQGPKKVNTPTGNNQRTFGEIEHKDGNSPSFDSNKVATRGTLQRLKKFDYSHTPYDPKAFGSLDSLRDLANGSSGSREDLSPRSSDGSDLVSSMSRALDAKLMSLRPSGEGGNSLEITEEEEKKYSSLPVETNNYVVNGDVHVKMRRKSSLGDEPRPTNISFISYRDPSLHRANISGISWSGVGLPPENGFDINEVKTEVTSRVTKSRSAHRRHSLSGTADILRFVLEDKNGTKRLSSTDPLPTVLSANILESHV